jgi:glutathione S-transferase
MGITPHYTALVTLLAILFYFYTGVRVSRTRRKVGLNPPVMMSGNLEFDRVFRVQMNTLEWMPIFLPLLWLFAYYISDIGAAMLGLVWIAARVWYMIGYTQAAEKRAPWFGLQTSVCVVLLVGRLVGIIGSFTHG